MLYYYIYIVNIGGKTVSVETELKDLILSKYKSLREFAITINMPYSTLDSVLKRGVNKANIKNIISICKELGINTENLGEGKIVFKSDSNEINTIAAHKDGIDWTDEELEDIENFKKFVLSKRNKK